MQHPASSTRELVHLAWPMLVAQLAMMANAVIDTAMAGRLTVIDLAAVGIAASIMATILMSLVSVLFALPPIISHLYGAKRQAEIGREIHQGIWVSLVLALVAIVLLLFPGPFIAISDLQPAVETKVRAYLTISAWGVPGAFALRLFFGFSMGIHRPRPVMVFNLLSLALKIPLNALFMYGLLGFPAMGAPGAAVATALDAWLMAALAWGWCLRNPNYAEFGLRAAHHRAELRRHRRIPQARHSDRLDVHRRRHRVHLHGAVHRAARPGRFRRAPDRRQPRGTRLHDPAVAGQCHLGAGRPGARCRTSPNAPATSAGTAYASA